MNSYCLAFDLSFNSDLGHFMPRGLIVEKENDALGYTVKKANPKTLKSYDLACSDEVNELLKICEKLNPHELHKRYNAKHRVAKPLNVLLKDKVFNRAINQFIEANLERFFELIIESKHPLCINLERKQRFENHQVFFAEQPLEPKFYFHKQENGIEYRLSLIEGQNELLLHEQNFRILLNAPPFVLLNKKVYSLKYINANKLKPFLNKEIIKIPQRTSVEYFKKFIKRVIQKAPVVAEGFEVITYNTSKSCVIKPTSTIFSEVYHLEVFFVYKNHSFSICDQTQKHVKLDYDDQGVFSVYETQRNDAQEQKFMDVLKNYGVHFLDSKLGTFDIDIKSIDVYHNLSKLIDLKQDLKQESIAIDFELNRFKINDKTSSISTQYKENKDWFDVEMTIKVGEFQFPFTSLIPNLKSGERFYELPDGTHFLIPREWFSRYKSIVNLGQVKEDVLSIQKNQFTLLEEAGIVTQEEINEDIIAYQSTGNLKAKLRAYQKEGVNWLVKNYQMELGACLADDMGLGKTLQSLAYLDFVFTRFEDDFKNTQEQNAPLDLFSILETEDKKLKALIVSPSSLTFNWHNETQKFCPHFSSLSYIGQNRAELQKDVPKADIVLTSYGTLLRDIDVLQNQSFNFIIIDESQQIKNRNSKIFKAINQIEAKHKLSLSGTPIENSLSDLWSQMQFINPNLLGNYPFFDQHFKKPIEREQDEEKINELKTLIAPYLLRRTKAEVAKDLPELTEQVYYSTLSKEQSKLYEEEKSRVRNYIIESKLEQEEHSNNKKNNKISILNALMRLRQLANHPKLINHEANSGKFRDVTAYLETLLQSGQKTLVFSSFTTHLQIYTDWCDRIGVKYNLLTGKTRVKDRETQVEEFENNDESLLFFISIKAGGTGLNLTKASYVIILDPWWNPFVELQAIGRAHRIGQTQNVNVVRFISKQTIEEKINQLQQTKKDLSDSIIESQITDEILCNLEYVLG